MKNIHAAKAVGVGVSATGALDQKTASASHTSDPQNDTKGDNLSMDDAMGLAMDVEQKAFATQQVGYSLKGDTLSRLPDGGMRAEQIETSSKLPYRRGKASRTVELETAIVRIVDERHPITVRGVCYALFTAGHIPSMAVGETAKVSRVMTDMRESGALDWKLIVDGTRLVDSIAQWSDPSEIIHAAVRGYRRDNWQEQPVNIEVWSEKSTVAGVLAPVLKDLGVTFRVMRGFGSFTAVKQAAEDSQKLDPDKEAVVLYCGDWDPSGLHMSEIDLPGRLDRYGSCWTFERIALLREDLDYLPSFAASTKSGDNRIDWFRRTTTADPTKCWELDAMHPEDLRERVRSAITDRMDIAAWEHSLRIETAEIQSMKTFHKAWQLSKESGAGHE